MGMHGMAALRMVRRGKSKAKKGSGVHEHEESFSLLSMMRDFIFEFDLYVRGRG